MSQNLHIYFFKSIWHQYILSKNVHTRVYVSMIFYLEFYLEVEINFLKIKF